MRSASLASAYMVVIRRRIWKWIQFAGKCCVKETKSYYGSWSRGSFSVRACCRVVDNLNLAKGWLRSIGRPLTSPWLKSKTTLPSRIRVTIIRAATLRSDHRQIMKMLETTATVSRKCRGDKKRPSGRIRKTPTAQNKTWSSKNLQVNLQT